MRASARPISLHVCVARGMAEMQSWGRGAKKGDLQNGLKQKKITCVTSEHFLLTKMATQVCPMVATFATILTHSTESLYSLFVSLQFVAQQSKVICAEYGGKILWTLWATGPQIRHKAHFWTFGSHFSLIFWKKIWANMLTSVSSISQTNHEGVLGLRRQTTILHTDGQTDEHRRVTSRPLRGKGIISRRLLTHAFTVW